MRLALTGVGELPVRVDVEYQYLSVILVVLSNNLLVTLVTQKIQRQNAAPSPGYRYPIRTGCRTSSKPPTGTAKAGAVFL